MLEEGTPADTLITRGVSDQRGKDAALFPPRKDPGEKERTTEIDKAQNLNRIKNLGERTSHCKEGYMLP